MEKLAEYAKWCKLLAITILAVKEVKRLDKEVEDWYFDGEVLKGWRYIGTNLSNQKGGVGFILAPEVAHELTIEHDEKNWGRIISVRV